MLAAEINEGERPVKLTESGGTGSAKPTPLDMVIPYARVKLKYSDLLARAIYATKWSDATLEPASE